MRASSPRYGECALRVHWEEQSEWESDVATARGQDPVQVKRAGAGRAG